MPLAAGERLGPYEIVGPLGAGGMGEVYRARDTRLGREVAVKVLAARSRDDEGRLRRFEQEARAVSALNHPNIVALFDVGEEKGSPWVVTELIEGETLRERLKDGALPQRKAVEYAVQIAQGLSAAHERGIVHRDLKPENLIVTRDGRVKILDFGLAKLSERAADEHAPPLSQQVTGPLGTPAPHSDAGLVLGTVGYMSPEQVRGQPVDHRSDLFSLGAILYELLAGRRAFQGVSAADTMSAILREDPPDLVGLGLPVSPAVDSIVRHCLEKSADERFQSARDLAFQLRALTGTSTSASGALPALEAPRRSAWPRLLAALGALVLAALAFVAGRRSAERPEPSFRQVTFQRGAIRRARFAPDGQTVVYAGAFDGRPFEVYSARISNPESRPLGLQADLFAVSASGELAVSTEPRFRGGLQFSGTLSRAPFGGGAPRPTMENVYEADWGREADSFAVVRSAEGWDRLEFPQGRTAFRTHGWISHPRVSPAGDRVAFLEHPTFPEDAGQVVVVGPGDATRVVSTGWQSVQGLAWSPDGNELWFAAARTGRARALYAATLEGRERLVARVPGQLTLQDVYPGGRALLTRDSARFEVAGLLPGESRERNLSWLDGSQVSDLSDDGRTLLFSELGEAGGGSTSAYLRTTDGGAAVKLGDGLPTSLSSDGRHVLVLRRTGPSTRVVSLPTGPGEAQEVTIGAVEDILWAYWHPDGRRVLLTGAAKGQALRTHVVDPAAGGEPKPVTPEGLWMIAISRDGDKLATVGTNKPIHIVSLATGQAVELRGSVAGDRPSHFSADGRSLFVFRRDEVPCKVWRVDLASGRRELFRELLPGDPAGVVALNEVQVLPDARGYVYSYFRLLSELFVAEGLR
jgi:hypothetical protein